MFIFQKHNRYFGQIGTGLEKSGENELLDLGAEDIHTTLRGLSFHADQQTLYRVNYCSRLFTRFLAPLITFSCHSDKYLHKTLLKFPWHDLMTVDNTFAVSANVISSRINHSQYAALRVKDALADSFRERQGTRPNVDTVNPDFRFHLHLQNNKATLYMDTSGGSLHRRGYRQETVEAPMQETLAAAIINLSKWDGATRLTDPMCGSGTLLAEALMLYCRIPAGFLRKNFGFMNLPDFDAAAWQQVKNSIDRNIRPLPANLLFGSDLDPEAVAKATSNCRQLPGGDNITFQVSNCIKLPPLAKQTIITNPPYGIRLQPRKLTQLLKNIGDFLKRCPSSTAFLYFGKPELVDQIGLRPAWKKELVSGGLNGCLVKYEIY